MTKYNYVLGYRFVASILILTLFLQMNNCGNKPRSVTTEGQVDEGIEMIDQVIDVQKYRAMYSKAVHEEDKDAQFELGKQAYNVWLEKGVTEAYQDAKIWLQKAADQGHKEANILLGDLIEEREKQKEEVGEDITDVTSKNPGTQFNNGRESFELWKKTGDYKYKYLAIKWLTAAEFGGYIGAEELLNMLEGPTPYGFFQLLPSELMVNILNLLSIDELLKIKELNKDFYKYITGQELSSGIRINAGVKSDQSVINKWTIKKVIDFEDKEIRDFTIDNIPTLFFTELIGSVKNLPKSFWPYLSKSNIHTVNLSYNQIGDGDVRDFAKALKATNVHTVDLTGIGLRDVGVVSLQETNVHTIKLSENDLEDKQVEEFVKNLKGTNVHTIDLRWNKITDQGAVEIARNLEGTNVHTVDLSGNYDISQDTMDFLVREYSKINWQFANWKKSYWKEPYRKSV